MALETRVSALTLQVDALERRPPTAKEWSDHLLVATELQRRVADLECRQQTAPPSNNTGVRPASGAGCASPDLYRAMAISNPSGALGWVGMGQVDALNAAQLRLLDRELQHILQRFGHQN